MYINTKFHACHESGSRDPRSCKWVVIHDTEGGPDHGPSGTADNTAAYFVSCSSGGSAHFVVDDNDVAYRCLADNQIPWGAIGANTLGLHIETAARASYPKLVWKSHRKMLNHAAELTARWCKQYNIPVTKLTAADLRAGKKGICGHVDVTQARLSGPPFDTHTDPGVTFPWAYFMHLVRKHRKALG